MASSIMMARRSRGERATVAQCAISIASKKGPTRSANCSIGADPAWAFPRASPISSRATSTSPTARRSSAPRMRRRAAGRAALELAGADRQAGLQSALRQSRLPGRRCLVLADGFYEYTAPADPKQKRKDRWLFTPADGEPFAVAGFVRDTPGIGEAFSLLTTAPSADVAPYHNRQIVLLRPPHWKRWLEFPRPSRRPAPAASRRQPQGRAA